MSNTSNDLHCNAIPASPPEPGRFTQNGSGMVMTFPNGDWVRSADFDQVVAAKDAEIERLRTFETSWFRGDGSNKSPLLAERDAEIAALRRQSSHWYEEFSRIAHQFRVAVDPGNVQKLNPEGNAKLAVEYRTRAEAAEAKVAELEIKLDGAEHAINRHEPKHDDPTTPGNSLANRIANICERLRSEWDNNARLTAKLAELRAVTSND